MSLLVRVKASKSILNTSRVIFTSFAHMHHAKDFKPGPYPKTEDERIAAAKKYNLLPEEYEPYPDDGNGLGDYPKIDALSGEARNPYYPWSIPAMARDFNEAVYWNEHIVMKGRLPDTTLSKKPLYYPYLQSVKYLSIPLLLAYISTFFPVVHERLGKEYPSDDYKWYTFELADSPPKKKVKCIPVD